MKHADNFLSGVGSALIVLLYSRVPKLCVVDYTANAIPRMCPRLVTARVFAGGLMSKRIMTEVGRCDSCTVGCGSNHLSGIIIYLY